MSSGCASTDGTADRLGPRVAPSVRAGAFAAADIGDDSVFANDWGFADDSVFVGDSVFVDPGAFAFLRGVFMLRP